MELMDLELRQLVEKAKLQGFLTYGEVSCYLPDEDCNSEKLDSLLVMLEQNNVLLVDTPPPGALPEVDDCLLAGEVVDDQQERRAVLHAPTAKLSDDPIRLYLSQMSEIPLFSREEEIALAKKIEITRKRFRRAVLGNDYALRQTVEILKRVHQGQLPFDRTIKVSLTERLTKEQVSARMPHNLQTLTTLIERKRALFVNIVRKSIDPLEKKQLVRQYVRLRDKCVTLAEELSLRSRRVIPTMRQLEQHSNRMEALQCRLAEIADDPMLQPESDRLRTELRQLIVTTQESPRSLRNRFAEFRKHFADFE